MRNPSRPWCRFALLLIAAALVVRALVPAGWMPTSQDGRLIAMLCSGKGAVVLPVRVDRTLADLAFTPRSGEPQDDEPNRDPCPFAVMQAHALDAGPSPCLVPVIAWHAPDHVFSSVTAARVAARGIRPPARGPPAFA